MRARNYSRKREAILEKIRSTNTHPSAEWIYRELKGAYPDLSLGTVYRNVSIFKEDGQIGSVGTIDGQERFDGIVEPHAHFICPACRAVIDIAVSPDQPELSLYLEKTMGLRVERVELIAYGTCDKCVKSGG